VKDLARDVVSYRGLFAIFLRGAYIKQMFKAFEFCIPTRGTT
jgi:hypothetical protein